MFKVFTKVGNCKKELHSIHKTFERAYETVVGYYNSYGGDSKLYKNGAKIVCNNEPVLQLTIRKAKETRSKIDYFEISEAKEVSEKDLKKLRKIYKKLGSYTEKTNYSKRGKYEEKR